MIGDLTRAEMERLLRTEAVGHLACCPNGRPYVVPIGYAYYDGCIYAHSGLGLKVEAMRQQMMEVLDLLCEPTDPPALQLRRAVAIFALHASTFIFRTRGVPDDERRAAALEVARELVLDQKPAGKTSEVETEAE